MRQSRYLSNHEEKELHESSPTGIDRNLTHYADPSFSRYLRRAFLASAGYDEADLGL